jgi:hypothetical protein
VVQSPLVAQPLSGGLGTGLLSLSGVGGFAPSNQWDDGLVGEKMRGFCASIGGLFAGGPPCS